MEQVLSADLHNLQTRRNIGKAKGLLHSLVPRAQSFCFFDTARERIWSSDGADDQEVDRFLMELSEDALRPDESEGGVIKRTLNSGRTVLLLPVLGDDRSRLGLLVAVFSSNAGTSSHQKSSPL